MQIFSCSEVIKQRLRYTAQWLAYIFCGGNDMRNRFAVIPNFKLNKQFFPERPPPPDTGCWLSPGWLCTRLAAKWPLRANKSLPKFTPIFLILPQTLVVCQNWLASNLEKDILRKCQKCRRMEDNSDCCSLVWPGPGSFQIHKLSLLGRIFSRCPIKDIQFLMGSVHIWLKQWRIICTERWIVLPRSWEIFKCVNHVKISRFPSLCVSLAACYPCLSGSGGRPGPRKTKAPGMTRHNCVMSYLNRRRCASGPGAEISCGLMTDRGLSTVSLHKMLGWPVISPRTPETRRKEEFRIISRLKRVIESFINKRVSCDLFEVKRGFFGFLL